MKKILFALATLAVVMTGCNRATNRNADHVHEEGVECSGDHDHQHDHPAVAHTHGDGPERTGDHLSHDGHDHTGHNHSHGDADIQEENPDEIVFPASQAARTDFEVQTVTRGDFHEVITASGRIMPAAGDEVTLVAPTPGIVSFADKSLAEGRQIGAATRLFYVSSSSVGSGDVVARDAAAYYKAKADFERAEKLLADRIVSQSEYQASKAAYEDAKAAYEALAPNASNNGVAVTGRISGFITSLSVREGDYVETGQVLATVSQNRRLVLRSEVSQRYMSRLSNIRSANFTTPYDGRVWQMDDMDGRLLSVSRNVTPGTPLIPVTFEFNNNGKVLPGTYVEVKLIGIIEPDAITIPLTSISEQQGLCYVYVQLDEECYMRREVKPGADDGVRVKILSGLEAGERVVTRGAVNIKMAAASGAIPHGHEH